jgi:site-specific DNA recombinase
MKVAYDYIRISDDDQSHFSIDGQKKMNIDFAFRHNIKIVRTFLDDGYSAKDFNRPNWKHLEKELAKNKSKVDYLIVWKYDRLIRNAAEGLNFIEKLEKKWNIVLLSVMENFGIDPNSPYFFKHRADLLVSAEFERRLISDRTKMGNWSAKDSGRFIGRASIGYDNARDNEDKPILVVNEERKQVVESIYSDFLADMTYPMIKQRVFETWGIKLKGHDAIKDIIANHTYAGLVKVPEYHGKKAYMRKGIHEPIIAEDVFWKAYYKLQDKIKPQGPKIVDDNVPLRGWVICQGCGGFHTGGKSKGRSAYYYYYRCKKCLGENYSSEKVHQEITEILKNLSFEEKYIKALITDAEIKLNKEFEGKNIKIKKLKSDSEQIKGKLDSLEEKYIANKVSQDTYDKWFPVYSRELNTKSIEIAELEKDSSEELNHYKQILPAFTSLESIYDLGGVDDKQSFLKGIFWGGFTKEKVGGRTKIINPMFEPNLDKISHLLRVENIKKPEQNSGFPFSTRTRGRTEISVKILVFETSASTNSAIRAFSVKNEL